MNGKIKKAWMLVAGVLCVFVAQAKITFTDLTDNYELSATAAQATTQFQANSSLTLKLTDAATDGTFEIKSSFYIPEGVTLTVNVPEGVTGVTIRMKGGLRGTGTVAFGAGVTKLAIGGAPTLTNILGDKNKMSAVEAAVRFAEDGGIVELTDGVSLVRWPTSDTRIAAGTIVAALGKDLFTADTLTLDQGWDLMLCLDTAVKRGCAITVPTGRTLYHRPISLYSVSSSSADSVQQWSGEKDFTHEVDIVLAGGTFMTQSKTVGNTILGDLSGTGVLALEGKGALTFEGCITFSGKVNISPRAQDCDQGTCYTFRTLSGSTLAGAAFSLANGNFRLLSFEPQSGSALAVGSVSGNGNVPVFCIGAGCTVNIGTLTGAIGISGSGAGAKAVVAEATSPLSLYPGVMLSIPTCDLANPIALVPAAGVVSGNAWGLEVRAETEQPVRFDFADLGSDAEITLGGKVRLVQSLPVSTIRIASGAEVSAAIPTGVSVVNDGGSLTELEGWKAKVALWLDASQAETLTYAKDYLATIDWSAIGRNPETANAARIYRWSDWRAEQTLRDIRAVTYDAFTKSTAYKEEVFPKILSDDGGSYMCWENNLKARLSFGAVGVKSTYRPISATCVIAVFGAQNGGGTALFMEENGRLARTEDLSDNTSSKDWPICLDGTVSARTNGVEVVVGSTGFTGGWQLITLSTEQPFSLKGIGHATVDNSGSGNGGQNYREILVFTEMPTESERNAAERYLAKKWGLPTATGEVETEQLSVSGSGTVKLAADATFDTAGYYSGTVDLNGKRLEIGSLKLPFRTSEIPSENRLIWVDPRLEGAVRFCDDQTKPDEVTMVYTRDNTGLLDSDGNYYLISPVAENENRRVRYTDGWFDFRNGYTASGDECGNMMFMRKLPYADMAKYSDKAEELTTVQSGFFVLDSSRNGGGSLMTSTGKGNDKILRARGTKASSPIWSLEPDSTVTIDTRINGEQVEMTDPFDGGRDVMSFATEDATNLLVKVFGFGNPVELRSSNNEILGEWLLYSKPMPLADRERVEAYLTFKWMDRFLPGFGETRDMSVSGAGTIAVANAASLPALAQDFTGVIELTPATLGFTLQSDLPQAVDAVVIEGQTVKLQDAVTVDIDITGVQAGTYLLMSAGELSPSTTFTVGTVTDLRRREVRLIREAGTLKCEIVPNGILLLVR